jgi:hypothetical protein
MKLEREKLALEWGGISVQWRAMAEVIREDGDTCEIYREMIVRSGLPTRKMESGSTSVMRIFFSRFGVMNAPIRQHDSF